MKSYTVEEMAGAMAAYEATILNIRDQDGRVMLYERELYKIKELGGTAVITPEGNIKFID